MSRFIRYRSSSISASLFVLLLGPQASYAAPGLIAIGKLDGSLRDLAATSAPLENGAPGNLLGGLGSGIAHAYGDTFLALPDRGPNIIPYNSCIDNTASYINRFQTLRLVLSPNPAFPGSHQLPFLLTPMVLATTLLSSPSALVYGQGVCCGLPEGAPRLNTASTYYFTGRSDNFDPWQRSNNPGNARFDPESIRVASDGKHVFVSDEYGPNIYRFDRTTGSRDLIFRLPDRFAVGAPEPVGEGEISSNRSARVANRGMEGLAITPDGKTLVGVMQSPLLQDGGTSASTTRIVVIDIAMGTVTHEYSYRFDNIGTAESPEYGSASEILAVNDHAFLVDERDDRGLGASSEAVHKKIYLIDLDGAKDVSTIEGEVHLAAAAVKKTLFLDVVATLEAGPASLTASEIPAKLEGMAFGDDVMVEGQTRHTLYIANDNDFDTDPRNPNQFFVFAFDEDDLGGERYVPQAVVR